MASSTMPASAPKDLLATMHNSEIEALMRLNVLSPIILTKYVVRHMMADGAGGRIVNMSSIIASTGYNGLSVYGATKAAATGFTRSLAREVGKLGITVNAIAPGFIDTELTHSLGCGAASTHRGPQRAAPPAGNRRRGQHGGISVGRGRPQHHRRGSDGGRREYGLTRRNRSPKAAARGYGLWVWRKRSTADRGCGEAALARD